MIVGTDGFSFSPSFAQPHGRTYARATARTWIADEGVPARPDRAPALVQMNLVVSYFTLQQRGSAKGCGLPTGCADGSGTFGMTDPGGVGGINASFAVMYGGYGGQQKRETTALKMAQYEDLSPTFGMGHCSSI